MQRIHLLVIDPQSSFCDPHGSLFVQGADQDMIRLATMVDRLRGQIEDVHVTLDSHRLIDISHPIWFKDEQGNHPNPFTILGLDGDGRIVDANSGTIYHAAAPSFEQRTRQYIQALADGNRYPHCIWPPHCLIGSPGHTIAAPLYAAFQAWEEQEFAQVDYVTKGSNPFTEHFSGVQAEVPDPQDPTTQINTGLISTLEEADIILLAGEASSHCLCNTVRDVAEQFTANGNADYVKKIVFLEDAASPVTGFENFADDFVKDMTALGMKVDTTTNFLS